MRRTKIVCTIGPASSSTEELDRLVAAGLDVARLNFSHGTHDEHADVIRRIRDGEARWGRPVAILQDLQGPKIRLGTFGPGGGARVDLEPGRPFTLCAHPVEGTVERASITHPEYLRDLRAGDEIWMDDGMIQLRVETTSPDEVRCRVVVGGRISDHKGLSLPRVKLPVSCLTDKDREDLRFGLRHGVDYVAVSFVRSADDIDEVRAFLRAEAADLPIVAKLERHEIVANLPGILSKVDAVMVARGDLGVDVPIEDVPHIQKEIIRQARGAKVPVIVATQMLESMVTHLQTDPRGGLGRLDRDLRRRRRRHAVGRDGHRTLPARGRRGDGAGGRARRRRGADPRPRAAPALRARTFPKRSLTRPRRRRTS